MYSYVKANKNIKIYTVAYLITTKNCLKLYKNTTVVSLKILLQTKQKKKRLNKPFRFNKIQAIF